MGEKSRFWVSIRTPLFLFVARSEQLKKKLMRVASDQRVSENADPAVETTLSVEKRGKFEKKKKRGWTSKE